MARQKQTTRSRQSGKPQSVVFSRFDGIRNADPRDKIKPTEFHDAVNVDLDRQGFPTRRDGYSVHISASNPHSVFSDGNTSLCVVSGNLMLVDFANKTLTALRNNVGDSVMSYVSVDDMVVYSNGQVIGYVISGVDYSFVPSGVDEMSLPQPGQIVGYFNGSLYICRENEIWITEPFLFNQVHIKTGRLIFDSYITMFAAMDDGIWVSTRDAIYYLSGENPHEMKYREVSKSPNASGVFARVDSRLFGGRKDDSLYGKIIVFPTDNGLCWATNGGVFGNITGRKYILPSFNRGAAIARTGSINQVIIAIQ